MGLTTPQEADKLIGSTQSETISEKIEGNFVDESFEVFQDGTPNKHLDMIITGEYSKNACEIVATQYVEAGWARVDMRSSSENGERGGLTSIKFYYNL